MEEMDQKTKEQAIKDYLNSNDSLRVVGRRYGVSAETIRRWILRSGNKTRTERGKNFIKKDKNKDIKVSKEISLNGKKLIKLPSEQRFNSNKTWTLKDDKILKEALLSGFTIKEVSELLGRSIVSIYNRKNALTDQGYIKKGLRFKTPRGVLRKKAVRTRINPEVSEMNRLIKKYTKINEAGKKTEKKKEVSQLTIDFPEEIKEVKHKEVKEIKIEKDLNPIIISDKNIPINVSLENLVEIVKNHNLVVSISMSKTGTEIRITK